MRRKLKEFWSMQLAKNPGKIVLGFILLFNIVFFLGSALVVSALSLNGTEQMGFIEAAFCTLTMILDPGCIQFVVADIGEAGVLITLFCLLVVIIGMISFTGAVIGYVTNYISGFIESANSSNRKLFLSDHIVILNWNSRASEIINDYLYSEKKQTFVVLTSSREEEIREEIIERISDTIKKENRLREEQLASLPYLARKHAMRKNRLRKNVNVIVRCGDVFSSKQLLDISLEKARSIIILGNDINNSICKMEHRQWLEKRKHGNSHTIKTLMQVADIASSQGSKNNQKIIVEITDDATGELVNKIVRAKQIDGKCDIVPIRVNQILGQILSQFSLMPELNRVYAELFSNKGAEIYTIPQQETDMATFAKAYLSNHYESIPLTFMTHGGKDHCFYMAATDKALDILSPKAVSPYPVKLNQNYQIERKNVVILGHNSKSRDIMKGFCSFFSEWNVDSDSILNIIVIDDQENLEKMGYYKEYPFVTETITADIFDEALICSTIERFVSANEEDTSILILSDDSVPNEDIDANALAHLVYVREIISRKQQDPNYDPGKIDVIVEIIDPKHHDIVNSYSINNVVISNRYISKMIAQIGEVDALFDFYADILSYDDSCEVGQYDSKEIYIKKVSRYFSQTPKKCTAAELIRGVLEASTDPAFHQGHPSPDFVIGHVAADGTVKLFGDDQREIPLELTDKDKLVIFSSH